MAMPNLYTLAIILNFTQRLTSFFNFLNGLFDINRILMTKHPERDL